MLREIRAESNVPVIMITAKGETTDKVSGLQMGADDYIVKPFEMKEVIARVHAVMRRVASEKSEVRQLIFDNLEINMEAFELKVCGKRVDTAERAGAPIFSGIIPQQSIYT